MFGKLKSPLGKRNVTNSQYLYPIDLNIAKSEKEFIDSVNLHAFSKEHIATIAEDDYYTRIDYDKQGLIAAYECQQTAPDFKENIPDFLLGIPYFRPNLHQPCQLVGSARPTGFSLGGKLPEIKVPYLPQLATPFQQIATIQRAFPGMEWLPVESLNIIYPLLSAIDKYLFIDYSNPSAPAVLEDHLNYHPETYYGPIPATGILEYKQTFLEKDDLKSMYAREATEHVEQFGGVGIPYWQQDYVLPYCPVSGRLMKFVCSLTTNGRLPLAHTNINFEGKYKNENIAHLNFWGSGTLNIFMEPETKIVGMIIQNS